MLRDLQKIWFLFTATEKRKVAGMLVLVVLMAMAETTGVVSIMPFLSVLGRPEVIHSNALLHAAYERFGFSSSRTFMIALGLASITTVIISAAFKALTLHRINRFVHLLRHTLSQRMLARYLHQPYEFFLEHNPAQLSRNVLSEVDQLIFSLIQPLSQMVAQGSMVLAMLALVFWYKPVLALCMVVVIGLLYGTIYGSIRNLLGRIGIERQTANGERFQSCSEALGGFKDVKVTHSAQAYQAKFDRASRLFSRHMATSDTLSQSPLYLVEAVGYTGLIALAVVLMLGRGDIAHVLPALGLFGFATYRMLPAAQIMYRGFAKLRFSAAALDAVYTDLSLPDRGPEAAADALVPRREIRFSNVGYAYPSAPGKPVLEHFNLVIPVGASIGIAGRTGAGKSTLMDLLLGLLHPLHGSITIDDTPLTAANAGAWQRAIGYVPQHIYLADASIAANIAFGVAPENIDMQAVERAARAAQIHDFVSSELADGYATTIGDRGIRLSGGQRQRVGIARALYRDPPVLLMDEATSALDSQTEEALNEALRQLAGTKTVVVIAHRATSLRDCHEVITLTPVSAQAAASDSSATTAS